MHAQHARCAQHAQHARGGLLRRRLKFDPECRTCIMAILSRSVQTAMGR